MTCIGYFKLFFTLYRVNLICNVKKMTMLFGQKINLIGSIHVYCPSDKFSQKIKFTKKNWALCFSAGYHKRFLFVAQRYFNSGMKQVSETPHIKFIFYKKKAKIDSCTKIYWFFPSCFMGQNLQIFVQRAFSAPF